MFDHIRAADRIVLLLNTVLLMVVAFLPFATSVLADAPRSGHGQRTAVGFYGIAFGVAAVTFNAVWQYARRHRLLSDVLDSAGATAISRRFQLALGWLATGALLGALVPVLGVAVIVAFNAFHWLPIRGERPSPQDLTLRGLDLGEAARGFEQPGVIGPTPWTALKVDRRPGEHKSWILAGQLQFDVGVQDVLAGGAARVSVLRAQQLVERTLIRHHAASVSSTG